jgi:hypothetical protein
MNYLDLLKSQFNDRVELRLKGIGIFQIFLPIFHEDGDMIEIYLKEPDENNRFIRVCDYGMTLMRLSYNYDIDTPKKEKILSQILQENKVNIIAGNIFIDTMPESLAESVLRLSHVIAKVASMRLYKREIIKSLFYDDLKSFIFEKFEQYKPSSQVCPIPEREELEVDYQFKNNSRPVYVFAIKDGYKARLAALCCREFIIKDLNFKSFIVHENFSELSKKDQAIITSASDKQFVSLDDFYNNGDKFLRRELFHISS